jgi:hypothetical protein
MTVALQKSEIIGAEFQRDLSHDLGIISSLKELTPYELGTAANQIRQLFARMRFREVMLNPFTAYPVDYHEEVMDVPSVGQLRFSTEPDIWDDRRLAERFFSISPLFRREGKLNLLRRFCFTIVDFYQPGRPESLLAIFRELLTALPACGAAHLNQLPFEHVRYDADKDAPRLTSSVDTRWVIATGYDAEHSFFEIDEKGNSTREELFLVTPHGFLEVAAFGIAGWNQNPHYVFRCEPGQLPDPPSHLSGMGFGLERLLLAAQVLSLLNPS